MLGASSPDHGGVSREDRCESDLGSAAPTDRFGFLLTNGSTDGSVGPAPELVRHREAKWINIISQWDHTLQKKNSKVKEQCEKGIPASLRAKCWPLLCGATERMKANKDLFLSLDSRPALQSWVDIIERDLDRQFPFHEMFVSKDGHGQRGLFRVLKAYTQYQPDEGYCQAQGPVAAMLLMNMPAEEAFWCLVQISEHYLPGYYSQLLEGVLFDSALLSWVLKRTCPPAHRHLQHYGVEPLMFATDWLMCLYSRHLPFNTLLHVWDLFFCYGVRVLFQVAVVLVRRVLGRAEQRQECSGQMETLEKLRGVRDSLGPEDDARFMAEVCSVPLSRSDLKRSTKKELEKWRQDRPSSTFDPSGRCQGYWALRGERDQKGGFKDNLSIPLIRSASTLSLSPSLLRKRWGKRNDAAKVERHHSMGVRGIGRESWMEARALGMSRVEEEDEHKTPGKLQSHMDIESTQPAGVKGPLKMVREPTENQSSPRNTLKVRGKEKEQEGRTMEDQVEQRRTKDSQGGLVVLQEVSLHHSDIKEGAVGVGAKQNSAASMSPQPRRQGQQLEDNNQSQAPEEPQLEDNNQSQAPEEQQVEDNNQSHAPEEQQLEDNNQSQAPEEPQLEDNNQSQAPEEPQLEDNNQSQAPEEPQLEDNNQSQAPEEQQVEDNNQSHAPEEQQVEDNNQSKVSQEQEMEDNNQSQVPKEPQLEDNNQSQAPEEPQLEDNNQSQAPEEQQVEDNNQSHAPEEQQVEDNNQSKVSQEQEMEDNNQSQVPKEQQLENNNQSHVSEEQELAGNNQVPEQQKRNSKQNLKEEVADKHRVKTLYQIAKQVAECKNIAASQINMSGTTPDTKTDSQIQTETQAVVDKTEKQSDVTPKPKTMTKSGQLIAMHADTGTTTESVVQKSTEESTAQQGPDVMIQTKNGSQEINDAEEGCTQEQINDEDIEEQVIFQMDALTNNLLPFQEVDIRMQKGVKQSEETGAESDFVVSTIAEVIAETTVVTEASSDICDAAKASCLDKACAEKEAICFAHTQADEETFLDTNAETEEDNDMRTFNKNALIENKEFNPKVEVTDEKMSSSLTGDAEQLTTIEQNREDTVDSAEVTTSDEHNTVDRQDSETLPQVQDANLPVVVGPTGLPCQPESRHTVGYQSSTPSRLARRLTEDIFTALQASQIISDQNPGRPKLTGVPSQTGRDTAPPPEALSNQPPSQAPPGPTETTGGTGGGACEQRLSRPGFFSRLRGAHRNHGDDRKAGTVTTPPKIQVPKIFIQNCSDLEEERPLPAVEEEQLSSRERRRRQRAREMKEKEEEKVRKRMEKKLKKMGRKGLQQRKDPCPGGETSPSPLSETQDRYSASYTDSYF